MADGAGEGAPRSGKHAASKYDYVKVPTRPLPLRLPPSPTLRPGAWLSFSAGSVLRPASFPLCRLSPSTAPPAQPPPSLDPGPPAIEGGFS